jgi:hypothetical protein
MINDKNLTEKIEKGQQVGQRFSFSHNGKVFWSSVGIQKWEGKYKVFVDEILDEKMDAEDYEREEIIAFESIEAAFEFIQNSTHADLKKLAPCKGQKIFNPRFN